jgi:hypothetical protein
MQNAIESIPQPVLEIFVNLCLVSVCLAIPGAILGLGRKLIIYQDKDDLNGAWIVLTASVVALIALVYVYWVGVALSIVSLFMLLVSSLQTYQANQSVLKCLLAVPTKFVVLVLVVVCGLLSLSIFAGIQSLALGRFKEGAKQLAAGGAGLAGLYFLRKFIAKLVWHN